jgi:hypothetical protein
LWNLRTSASSHLMARVSGDSTLDNSACKSDTVAMVEMTGVYSSVQKATVKTNFEETEFIVSSNISLSDNCTSVVITAEMWNLVDS